jgi:RHS repeat-associated protein
MAIRQHSAGNAIRARERTTSYAYSSANDLLSITYANGTQQQYSYNPLGEATQYLNARGQAIGYTYNAQGLVAGESIADGTSFSYSYDARGNLTSATDAQGKVTKFVYGNASNPELLTEVDYPDGTWLKFSYNIVGQRTQSVDQTGFTVNYSYDSLGRLSELTDANKNLIVQYSYDSAGKLIQKDMGNGTRAVYAYDGDGNVLSITNYAPDHVTVNSFDDYTYDSRGNVLTDTNQDGQWVYSYDADSQLIHAVFTPNATDPDGLTAQDLQYVYDAAGNRLSETVNGVTTVYTANNVNEYTSSTTNGVTTNYQYDLDGNLIAQTTGSSSTNYTFNVLNQLTRVNGPGAAASYGYDPLGNRVTQTINGVTTQLQVDPSGLGNVVATFDSTRALTAHYTYGFGLVSQAHPTGTAGWYDIDGNGNTIGITNEAGNYVSKYEYLPFGEAVALVGGTPNPFAFVGMFAVASNGFALDSMRGRFYDTVIGRFISTDADREPGNLYVYAANDPTTRLDPSGNCWVLGPVQGGPANFIGGSIGSYAGYSVSLLSASYGLGANVSVLGPGGVWPGLNIPPFFSAGAGVHAGASVLSLTGGFGQGVSVFGYSHNSTIGYEFGWGWGPGCPDDKSGKGPSAPPQHAPDTVPHPQPNAPPPPLGDVGLVDLDAAFSVDPNSMTGPAGYSTANFLSDARRLPYQINFENAPTATAPAQRVDITDQLDPNLDWSTFQLAAVGFGRTYIAIPAGLQHYDTTVNVTENGQTFEVVISLNLDPAMGIFSASFQSLDPNTNLPPASLLTGFLPPEDGSGRGVGFVSFTISPKAGLATGTQIRNLAGISFDLAPIITTDQKNDEDPSQGIDPNKQALVTIDSGPPTSSVAPLPAVETSPSFTVSWSGQDDAGGSGIAFFNIYVSDNGGPFTPFLLDTTQTSATFTGVTGHTYGFSSVATDNVGNREATPTTSDATTTVESQAPTVTQLNSDDANGFVYGQSETFTATVTASGTSDTPTGSIQFVIDGADFESPVTLNAGDATLTTSALTAGSHTVSAIYTSDSTSFVNSTSATFTQTVAPAPLTITADDKTKVYGDPLPALTVKYTGLVNGDTPAVFNNPGNTLPIVTTTATQTSDVLAGGYPITASGAVNPNYSISYVNGTLTITPANQTITWSNPADIYYRTPLSSTQLNAAVSVIGPCPGRSVDLYPARRHRPRPRQRPIPHRHRRGHQRLQLRHGPGQYQCAVSLQRLHAPVGSAPLLLHRRADTHRVPPHRCLR